MVETKMVAEYKGYKFQWNDRGYYFGVFLNDTHLKDCKSLEECEQWVDKKTKEKFDKVPVIIMASYGYRHGKYQSGHITSIIDGSYVWFVNDKKDRSKENVKHFTRDTEENRTKIDLIRQHQELIETEEGKIKDVEKSIPMLTIEELRGDK